MLFQNYENMDFCRLSDYSFDFNIPSTEFDLISELLHAYQASLVSKPQYDVRVQESLVQEGMDERHLIHQRVNDELKRIQESYHLRKRLSFDYPVDGYFNKVASIGTYLVFDY